MSWENNKDPWGGNKNNGNNQQPPDLDEMLEKIKNTMNGIFGTKKNSGNTNNSQGGDTSHFPLLKVLLVVFVIIALIWAFLGFYAINEQERGVVLRFGKYNTTLTPGLRWQPPLIDEVVRVNQTRIRDQNFSGDMLTKDENIVRVTLQVQYDVADPKAFVLNVRNPEQSLSVATDSALRHVVGGSKLDDVITSGRAIVASEIQQRLQSYLDIYQSGLSIRAVNVLEAKPPVEVKPAFDDVIKAREDKVRLVNEATAYANGVVPEARGKAQRILADAEGYKQSIIARARGEANRFLALTKEYAKAPDITKKRLYLETMQKVLSRVSKVIIDTESGNNMMYLPLDQILKNRGGSISNNMNLNEDLNANSVSESDVQFLTDRIVDEIRKRQRASSTGTLRSQTNNSNLR